MTDGEALLRAILENPADDTARLVYADWLEENGKGKWAEFIRREVAREPDNKSDAPQVCVWSKPSLVDYYWGADGKTTLWRRGEIREACSLLPRPPAGDDYPDWHASFRRGFASEIHLPLAEFLTHAESLFAAHPVEKVVLTDREPWDLGYGWCWYNGSGDVAPDYLPDPIWRDSGGDFDCTRCVRAFPEDCHRALGLRCVAHGRSLAGLPPLPAEAAAWA